MSLLRGQSCTNGGVKFLLPFLQVGISLAQAQEIEGSNFPLVIYAQDHFTHKIERPGDLSIIICLVGQKGCDHPSYFTSEGEGLRVQIFNHGCIVYMNSYMTKYK